MRKNELSDAYNKLADVIRKKDLQEYLSLRGISTNKATACPFCGKGTNSPCASYDKKRNRFHCFSCGGDFSVLDFIALDNNLDAKRDYWRVIDIGAGMFGLQAPEASAQYQKQPKTEHIHTKYTHNTYTQNIHTAQAEPMSDKDTAIDFTSYFNECHDRLNDATAQAYLKKRGLTKEVCDRFNLGFDPAWSHPRTTNAPKTPRLIIPTGKHWYTARDTREKLPKTQEEFKKMKVNGTPKESVKATPFFNESAIDSNVFFVVEGEIDAISIEALGYHAVGLGTASRVVPFAKRVCVKNPHAVLLLALDNEEGAGSKQGDILREELQKRGIKCAIVSRELYGAHKDANECLTEEQGYFKEALANAYARGQAMANEIRTERLEQYKAETQGAQAVKELVTLSDRIGAPYPTGFKCLDKILDGGFYPGFYVIGAISSIGKTAITLQIADQIASGAETEAFNFEANKYEKVKEEPKDVLIFSLEMSRVELIGRSVSRITCQKAIDKGIGPKDIARTYFEIRSPRLRKIQDKKEGAPALLVDAINEYGHGPGKNVYIIEGVGNLNVYDVRQKVQDHIELTGKKPFVIIDYLQLLSPINERGTDKQNTDTAVLELKRLSRDLAVPVVVISSFNRASYASGATINAFKESGAIEYTVDVAIGLFLQDMNISDKASQKDIQEEENRCKHHEENGVNVRNIGLSILKNRNGKTGYTIGYKYFPAYNLFQEVGLIKEEKQQEEKRKKE